MDEGREDSLREYSELKAIGISLVFLVLGFAVLWLAKSIVNIEGNPVYVSLLFIPVLVYVTISGRLKELKVPGDWKRDFRRPQLRTSSRFLKR